MSIQSVDNFQINVAKPIDSRMVTSGTVSRNNLPYRYDGLRVYDISQDAPFVWMNGVWKQESSGSGSSSGSISTGTANRVLKYTTSSTIGNSSIVDLSTGFSTPGTTNIGIGRTPGGGYALDVNGKVRGSIFEMSNNTLDGIYLKDSSVNISKIAPHTTNGYVLKTVGSIVQWVSDVNTSLVVANETSVSATHYLLFTDVTTNTTGSSIFANNATSRLIGVKPSTSQILGSSDLTTNGSVAPAYSFSGTTDAGLYGNSGEIGLSFAGKSLLKLSSTTISLLDTAGTTVLSSGTGLVNFGSSAIIKSQATSLATSPDYTWTGDLTTGMYRPATNQVALTTNGVARFTVTNTMSTISTATTISGATTLSSTLAVTGASTLSSTLAVTSAATFSSTLAVSTSQSGEFALLVKNTNGHGIQTTTNGEFFRSIQNTGVNYNYMAFHKTAAIRRGYIGYGGAVGDNFIIGNETPTGSVVIYTNSTEVSNISTATFSVKSTTFDITNVKLKGMYATNEFNFINNDSYNDHVYINYRGASDITSYKFWDGKLGSGSLSNVEADRLLLSGIDNPSGNLFRANSTGDYVSKNDNSILSGTVYNYYNASWGTLWCTWTKVGAVITIHGKWQATYSNSGFWLPIQPVSGQTISRLYGVASPANGLAHQMIQDGANSAKPYLDGNTTPNGTWQFSISYVIGE